MEREDRVIRWFCRFERFLVRLVIAAAVILVLVQALAVQSPTAGLLDLAGLDEHRPVAAISNNDQDKTIVITFELLDFSSLGRAQVLVNGSPAADFSTRYTTVKVAPGDAVEIDGTFYDRSFRIKLLDVYPVAVKPVRDVVHTVRQERHLIGIVELKD